MSTKAAHRHLTRNADAYEKPTENRAPSRTQVNNEERFHLIQIRAYSPWEQDGKPDDDAAPEQF